MTEPNKTKVLVADDEKMIANTLAIILRNDGYDVRAVYSGEAAVELAQTFRPHILISDVIMQGMTGIEAAMEICAALPDCKILLFSGQAATANLLRDAKQRNYDFEIFAKPIHPADLLAKLRNHQMSVSA